MNNQPLSEFLEKELIIGYVNSCDGTRQTIYFEKSSANIANFIMLHQENTDHIILTDLADRFILDTFGEFINRCPDQTFLQEVLKELVPMQTGEKNPIEIEEASEKEYHRLLFEEDQRITEMEIRML
ncbi:hypothetical protein [Lacrimispora sp.]|jgi:hypothetical protein|uniref:hypothetical protein n=1 Tax=Lacrimispora sp. TaxID=2719234 RepID=UPI0029E448DC|nr:hypothetical protein [Lacrimispora sp.]